jgi:3-oxoacyl-[acyl-carrier-protein] synthase II
VSRRVVVTGAGVISPLGDSPAGLHAALCAGRTALKPIELFATDGLGCHQAGELRPFEPRDYLGERNLRPVDRTSRLVLVAAQKALESSGWTPELRARAEVGLALGTNFCSVRTIAEFDRRGLQLGPSYASPLDFANSVINAAAGQAAIWHDLRGINSTISAGEASGLQAIAYAADLVRGGGAEVMLAGGVEELCFESFVGYYRAGRLSGSRNGKGGAAVPFDARRNGFALAEGSALLALEEAEAAASRGAAVLAEVLGHGSAFSVAREAGEAAGAVARSVRLALEDAGLEPRDVDLWSASASGSVEVDRWEALGVSEALGPRLAELPVTAVKAMLGEAIGASGALQDVSLLGTFRDGALPGIAGLERLEADFPSLDASPETRLVKTRRALLTAVSADGHCCALVLGSPA